VFDFDRKESTLGGTDLSLADFRSRACELRRVNAPGELHRFMRVHASRGVRGGKSPAFREGWDAVASPAVNLVGTGSHLVRRLAELGPRVGD
jgi:hypothetical protein